MKQRLLLPIPFLLWALVLLHASPGWSGPAAAEYEGNAAVPIVGGNQVSARRRALLLARRDAVSRAVASLLSEERIAALEARLRKEIHARASHYVRSHRVLEESQEARRFRVKVAARLDMSRLEEDLNRLIGPDKSPPGSPPPSRVHLSHRFDESWPLASRGTAKARVLAKLKARGLRVQSGDAPGVPRGNDETLGIVVALSIAENQAIRGTGWPAIKVDIALELSRGKEVVARIKAAAWGAEPTPDAALASALSGSLSSGLEALLRQPTARAILAKLRPGWVELRVTGVSTTRQIRQIRRQVCSNTPGVRGCMLDQVGQGEAHFSINTRRTSEALASAMDGRKLSEEYALKIQRIEGGQVWLTVVKVEPKIDDETDGAAQDTESEG